MSELASPTGILLILILLGLGAFVGALLLTSGEMLRQIADLEAYGNKREKQADHNSGVLFRVADMADQLRIATAENTTSIDAMRREMGHLSDDVRGEVGTSRAIEMARSGASKADIAAKTGLPIEEAEALVTFHGKKRKS